MGELTPREPLYERVARLTRDRRVRMGFAVALIVPFVQVASNSHALGLWWPVALALAIVVVGIVGARIVAVRREQAGMAARSGTAIRLYPPTAWPQLDEALDGYRALTGEAAPVVAVKQRKETGDAVDAELTFMSAELRDGRYRSAVSPFAASAEDIPYCGFNETMLDTFSARELLAVMLHLMYRAEFARSESARLSNGVCEADSKTLLLMRDHVALLSAIEKTSGQRRAVSPASGYILFSSADTFAAKVGNTGLVTKWATRDRVAELRSHLGALALDVPS